MKNTLVFILALIMGATAVFAGSIDDLQYKDSNLFWDITRTTNDHTVIIDADTLNGKNASELGTTVNNYHGGGLNSGELGDLLFDDQWFFNKFNFVEYLKTIFGTQDRLDKIEAIARHGSGYSEQEYDMWAGLIKATRTGEMQLVNGARCYPKMEYCII